MFLMENVVVTSPSDLTTASKCEFAFARLLDGKLGRVEIEKVARDALEQRASELGDAHEDRHLAQHRAQHGAGVIVIERNGVTRQALEQAASATIDALLNRAPVVVQATFFDWDSTDEADPPTPMIGYADFLVLQPDGRYRVQDAKLARSPKVTALLQLAAYHEQLTRLGIPVDDTVELILGTDEVSRHDVNDILLVYRARRARLLHLVRERIAADGPIQWGDPSHAIDGRCELCEPEVVAARDLLLVAGMRLTQRAKLRDAGIATIDELASAASRPEGCDVPERTFAALRQQAELQVSATTTDEHGPPPHDMFNPKVIGDLPAPDPGDIFFDFEGDPLYSETRRGELLWGIDYLFGLVDRDEKFTAFWAHDLEQEKTALIDFLSFVEERRAQHPNMHIYHYASYERTHLLSIAALHGVGEHAVDQLLAEGVLVDLYPVVKKSVRVGGRSYSIKKLEPLYMGSQLREGVDNAADSIAEYVRACEARLAGQDAAADAILTSIADYNEYDCVSTVRLHGWLLAEAATKGVFPGTVDDEVIQRPPFEPSPLSVTLLERAASARFTGDVIGGEAYELASAAVDYHQREDKSFWWEHFARLEYPVDEWENDRGVFMVTGGRVVSPWATARTASYRTLELTGSWAPGSKEPRDGFALYDDPVPYRDPYLRADMRLPVDVNAFVLEEGSPDSVTLTEACTGGEAPWDRLPLAIVPGRPLYTKSLKAAIGEVGTELAINGPDRRAIDDILWRQPSRTRRGMLEPAADPSDTARAVAASILDLDDSYLAVQGPPGTGKTHLAAEVIITLVRDHGWRIGVVAQSHKVVENVLRKAVELGLDPALVAKAPGEDGDYTDEPFTALKKDGQAAFATRQSGGYVLGGSAWDFTNLKRFRRRQLDLLVIDEAGQFSLAATMAVGVSARNLLLLGDPQQLPQVSQGTHPAPVDQSALGYIADGHAVLPDEFGYFLEESWRMHSAVAAPVSRLSYDGELRSNPIADERMLDRVVPGLHPVPVEHWGNAVHSVEEAAAVVEIAVAHLGRQWTDEGVTRRLGQDDVIVLTPYNAQVETIRVALDAAALPHVRVGTVDKFQGQEAVVSIVSLAASSAEDVPRGISFVLSRNRLNVAISRAQWAAYLVHSPALADFLPEKPDGVAELSRFIRLVGSA